MAAAAAGLLRPMPVTKAELFRWVNGSTEPGRTTRLTRSKNERLFLKSRVADFWAHRLERIAMNYGRITISAFAATVTYYVFGSVGSLLFAKYYSAYAAIFRPRDLIMNYMSLGFAGTFVAMFVLTMI